MLRTVSEALYKVFPNACLPAGVWKVNTLIM